MGFKSPPDDLDMPEDCYVPECMTMERMIRSYAKDYGLDPAIVAEKDIVELVVNQMLQNADAWAMYWRSENAKRK